MGNQLIHDTLKNVHTHHTHWETSRHDKREKAWLDSSWLYCLLKKQKSWVFASDLFPMLLAFPVIYLAANSSRINTAHSRLSSSVPVTIPVNMTYHIFHSRDFCRGHVSVYARHMCLIVGGIYAYSIHDHDRLAWPHTWIPASTNGAKRLYKVTTKENLVIKAVPLRFLYLIKKVLRHIRSLRISWFYCFLKSFHCCSFLFL